MNGRVMMDEKKIATRFSTLNDAQKFTEQRDEKENPGDGAGGARLTVWTTKLLYREDDVGGGDGGG